jgi:hypothetical protein
MCASGGSNRAPLTLNLALRHCAWRLTETRSRLRPGTGLGSHSSWCSDTSEGGPRSARMLLARGPGSVGPGSRPIRLPAVMSTTAGTGGTGTGAPSIPVVLDGPRPTPTQLHSCTSWAGARADERQPAMATPTASSWSAGGGSGRATRSSSSPTSSSPQAAQQRPPGRTVVAPCVLPRALTTIIDTLMSRVTAEAQCEHFRSRQVCMPCPVCRASGSVVGHSGSATVGSVRAGRGGPWT